MSRRDACPSLNLLLTPLTYLLTSFLPLCFIPLRVSLLTFDVVVCFISRQIVHDVMLETDTVHFVRETKVRQNY